MKPIPKKNLRLNIFYILILFVVISSSVTAQKCNDFSVTNKAYSEFTDLNIAVKNEFSNEFSIASWKDLKLIEDIDLWISCMGMKEGQMFIVTLFGAHNLSGQQYYIQYFPSGQPYAGFLEQDQIGGKLFLGSGSGLLLYQQILVINKPQQPKQFWTENKYAYISTNPGVDNSFWVNTAFGAVESIRDEAIIELLFGSLGKAVTFPVSTFLGIIQEAKTVGGTLESFTDFQLLSNGENIDYSYDANGGAFNKAYRITTEMPVTFIGFTQPKADYQSLPGKATGYPLEILIIKNNSRDLRSGSNLFSKVTVFENDEVDNEISPYFSLLKEQILLPEGFYEMRWGETRKHIEVKHISYPSEKIPTQISAMNKETYPIKTRFIKLLRPGMSIDTTFYMNDNRVNVKFEPVGIDKNSVSSNLWTEMNLTINSREIDLYGFHQHGPGFNQVGMWEVNQQNDFSEIIKHRNNNYPANLNTKVLKKYSDNSISFEFSLELKNKPGE